MFIKLTNKNEKIIIDNCEKEIKDIIKDFINKFNIVIHETQIVDILY